ncbi:alpha/beta hydrolase [Streptomyces chlorus]|uniref:Alpha/beta hydrolase n=1 Tax=Streptomyces chlorus TaxID=887452 RepID=A0ABW1DSG0_9ACTN
MTPCPGNCRPAVPGARSRFSAARSPQPAARSPQPAARSPQPVRHLLAFDSRGPGLVTEILGDLAHADRVAVLVPGSDTTGLDAFGRFRRGAEGRAGSASGPVGSVTGTEYQQPLDGVVPFRRAGNAGNRRPGRARVAIRALPVPGWPNIRREAVSCDAVRLSTFQVISPKNHVCPLWRRVPGLGCPLHP